MDVELLRIEDPAEAMFEAADVDAALEMWKHRIGPDGKCWASESAVGPHPGCAEFAPPDEWACPDTGEWWVFEWEEIPFNMPQPVWQLMCTRHATLHALEIAAGGGAPVVHRH